jgi:hypothetical protein
MLIKILPLLSLIHFYQQAYVPVILSLLDLGLNINLKKVGVCG